MQVSPILLLLQMWPDQQGSSGGSILLALPCFAFCVGSCQLTPYLTGEQNLSQQMCKSGKRWGRLSMIVVSATSWTGGNMQARSGKFSVASLLSLLKACVGISRHLPETNVRICFPCNFSCCCATLLLSCLAPHNSNGRVLCCR